VEPIQTPPSSLNSNHLRRLLVSCQYIDKLLSDIESVLNQSSSSTLFKKYRDDLSPMQRKLTQDYIARIRARLARVLDGQNLPLPEANIGATHSVRTALDFIDIAAEELKPKYMRGYGEVPESAVPELNGIVSELQGLVQKLNSYLGQGSEADLSKRLAKLERTSSEIELLSTLNRIIGEHGLVEFRQAVSMLAERLEEGTFEIAFFGRVSSGKSSLLNRLVGSDLLPVGVNPITAVPTRIVYGPTAQVQVWFADKAPQRFPIDRLAEFAAEQNNPTNSKHVVRMVVEVPSDRLRAGVVLVDTPGLGSLATSGAAETLAYLPRCDLGVVLIDAGSTLTQEDVSTVGLLYDAGTPALVVLSKADLIGPNDRDRASAYIAVQMKSQLGLELEVPPVSAMNEHTPLLDRWIDEQVLPLYEQHHLLVRASLRRKIGSLRESVKFALDALLSRGQRVTKTPSVDARAIEAELRREEGEFERARQACQSFTRDFHFLSDSILTEASRKIIESGLDGISEEAEATVLVLLCRSRRFRFAGAHAPALHAEDQSNACGQSWKPRFNRRTAIREVAMQCSITMESSFGGSPTT
jgi:GTP-binding protein EngB required for normal cell division